MTLADDAACIYQVEGCLQEMRELSIVGLH